MRVAALAASVLAVAGTLCAVGSGPAGAQTKAQSPGHRVAPARWIEKAHIGRNLRVHADSTLGITHTTKSDVGGPGYGSSTNVGQAEGLVASFGSTEYLSDPGANVVRALDLTTGAESILAGMGACGYDGDGGPATSADLCRPEGIAVDAQGNVYIADAGNGVVRMVPAASGTFWGTPMTKGDIYTITGGLGGPTAPGLAIDGAGNLVIGAGDIEVLAATSGTFYGTAMTADTLYTVAAPADGGSIAAVSVGPGGSIFAGEELVANVPVYEVDQLSASGALSIVAGGGGSGPATSLGQDPVGLATGGSSLYVLDGHLGGYRSVDLSTGHESYLSSTSAYWNSFPPYWPQYPSRSTTDQAGNLYFDADGALVMVPATSGTFYGQAMTAGNAYAISYLFQSAAPHPCWSTDSIAVDAAGDLFFTSGNQVCELPASEVPYGSENYAYVVAGSSQTTGGFGGDGGPAYSAQLDYPGALVATADGLLIGDVNNDRVRFVAYRSGTFYGRTMTAGDIYTVAGDGTLGDTGDGGAATSAALDGVQFLSADGSGDVFLTDTTTNTVRMVAESATAAFGASLAGDEITTVAGNGSPGTPSQGATATSQPLSPGAIAAGTSGTLYLASADQVFSVSPTSDVISLVAGDGNAYLSTAGAAGAGAEVYPNGGIGLDAAGNLEMPGIGGVAVLANTTGPDAGIAMTAGGVYTLPGTSGAQSGVGVDAGGDAFFSSSQGTMSEYAATASTVLGHPVPAGSVTVVAGNGAPSGYSGDGAPAGGAELNFAGSLNLCPSSVTNDIGSRHPAPARRTASSGGGGACPLPSGGTAVDSAGDVAIADGGNGVVRFVPAQSGTYFGIAMTSGDIYTIAGGGSAGAPAATGTPGRSATLQQPTSAAFDSYGNLYVTDAPAGRVYLMPVSTTTPFGTGLVVGDVYTLAGDGLAQLPSVGGSPTATSVGGPSGIAFDASGDLVFSDSDGAVLLVAASSGTRFGQTLTQGDLYEIAGTAAVGGGPSTGNATSYQLDMPVGVAGDLNDDVFFADAVKNQVFVVTDAGDLEVVAGSGSSGDYPTGAAQAPAVDAAFDEPTGVAVDWAGNLFVTDTGNQVVREIDVAGNIADVAGTGGKGDAGDGGPAASATFDTPAWLSLDTGGDLLVTDGGNNRIRMVVGAAAPGPEGGPCGGAETYGNGSAPDAACMAASEDSILGPDSGQVSTLTGYYSLNLPLISIPNRGGPLGVSLSYNSHPPTASGPVGDGWSLSPLGLLTVDSSTGDVTVVSGDGSSVTFVPQSTGNQPCPGGDAQDPVPPSPPAASTIYYCAPARVQATLVQDTKTHVFTEVVNRTVTNVFTGVVSGASYVYLLSTSKDLEGDTTTYRYDAGHQLTSVTDAGGRAVRLTWTTTTPAEVATITDAFGDKYQLGYGGAGSAYLQSVTEPGSRVISFSYDGSDRLSSVLDPDAQTGGPDAGAATTITYDAQDRVLAGTDPAGDRTTFSYLGVNQSLPGGTTTITDADGWTTLDAFHLGELVATTTGTGTRYAATTRFSYDPATTMLSGLSDPDGHSWSYTYNQYGDLLQKVDPMQRVTTYTYDALGDPLTITDPEGNTVTSTYNAYGDITSTTVPLYTGATAVTTDTYASAAHPGDLTSQTDADGGVTSYTYDAYGNVLTATDPMDGVTAWTYDLDGRKLSETDPSGNKTSSSYSAAGNLASTTDPNGGTTKYTYDANGNKLASTDPLSRKTTWAYDAVDLPTATTDPLGRKTTTVYDGDGRALSVTNPLGLTTKTTYDPEGRALTTTDPLGTTTSYAYDPAGNKVAMTNGDGYTTRYAYDADNEMVRVVDASGATESYGYDADGEPTTVTDALGNTTTTAYDENGRKISVTTPLGEFTSYTYDADGNRLGTTDALGNTTTTTYDPDGRVKSVTDAAGDETTYTYYADGKVETSVAPDGNAAGGDPAAYTTSYTYDHDGNTLTMTVGTGATARTTTDTYDADDEQLTVTSPLGEVSKTGYDADGEVTTTTDPLGGVTKITHNAAGERLTITDPAGGVVTYKYDADGRVLTTKDADGNVTSKTYDGVGNVLTSTDGLGAVTSYTYDADGHVLTEKDPTSGVTTRTYDPDGRVTAVEDPNGDTTTYTYDADGRRVQVTDPLGRATSYDYDAAGRLVSTTDALGRTTATTYDDANRVTGLTYSDGATPDVRYGYDADGERTSMVDGTGTTTYSYDNFGELTSTTNGAGSTIGYSYDADGRTTALTYPNGKSASYAYDAAGDLVTVTDWLGNTTTYGYNADGSATSQTLGGSTDKLATAYDANQNVKSITLSSSVPATLLSLTNTYDKDGHLTKQVGTGAITGTQTFAYDASQRVIGQGATSPAPTNTYAYDAAGYITKLQTGATQTYDGAGELQAQTPTSGAASSYSYDAAGERTGSTGGTTTTFSWDQSGTLTSASTASASSTYTYDGDGLRMSSTTGSTTTGYTWDVTAAVPHLLADGTNFYLYGLGDTPIEQIAVAAGTVSYLVRDELGSVRAVVSATGSVSKTATYNAYGSVSKGGVGSSTPFGFTGGETDPTGLVYMDHRYYDPSTAQFISVDPMVTDTMQPYAYAADDPTNVTDPTGDMPCNGGGFCGYHMPVLTPQQVAATNALDQSMLQQSVLIQVKQQLQAQRLKDFKALTAIFAAEDNAQQTQAFQSSWRGAVSDLCAGIGDSFTFGLTSSLRNALISGLGRINPVNEQSGWYTAGSDIGLVVTFLVPGGAEAKAAEEAEQLGKAAEAAAAAGDAVRAIADAEHAAQVETTAIDLTMSEEKTVDEAIGQEQEQETCILGGGLSFTSNTLVVLADGHEVPISSLRAGDKVLATDPGTGKAHAETVAAVWLHHDTGLLDVVVATGGGDETIHTTANHPIFDATAHAWVPASHLKVGDRLRTADGKLATVAGLVAVTGAMDMWDLTVVADHDFYVQLGSTALLVHNCGNTRNGHLAGANHPNTDVPFDESGYPDFSQWRHPEVPDVTIEPSGTRSGDFARANKAAGLEETPEDYTWHHNQEPGVMQLIERSVHAATGHTGGFSIWGEP